MTRFAARGRHSGRWGCRVIPRGSLQIRTRVGTGYLRVTFTFAFLQTTHGVHLNCSLLNTQTVIILVRQMDSVVLFTVSVSLFVPLIIIIFPVMVVLIPPFLTLTFPINFRFQKIVKMDGKFVSVRQSNVSSLRRQRLTVHGRPVLRCPIFLMRLIGRIRLKKPSRPMNSPRTLINNRRFSCFRGTRRIQISRIGRETVRPFFGKI